MCYISIINNINVIVIIIVIIIIVIIIIIKSLEIMGISVVVGRITHVMYVIIRAFFIFSKICKLWGSLLETEVKSKLPLEVNNTCFQGVTFTKIHQLFLISFFFTFSLFLLYFLIIKFLFVLCFIFFSVFLPFFIFIFVFIFFHFFKLPDYCTALDVLVILFLNVCKLYGTMYSYISKAYKKKWGKAYVVLEQNTVGIVTIRTIM